MAACNPICCICSSGSRYWLVWCWREADDESAISQAHGKHIVGDRGVSNHHTHFVMYLNLIQLAESFGVSEKVVEGWIREEGLPHTPDRGRLLFDRAQVVQWAATRGLAAPA